MSAGESAGDSTGQSAGARRRGRQRQKEECRGSGAGMMQWSDDGRADYRM